jgi:ribulose-phosphate 3-epimerase
MAMDHPVQLAPSMMCANLWRLAEEVRELEAAPVDLFHFDLMDAHFVPNMPLGLGLVEQLRPHTQLPFDAHLMVENNDFFVEKLAGIGVQQISVHAESATHLDRTLSLIRSYGIKAGVALNPATPLAALLYVLEQLDFVLIMTVNPGFAGQKMVPAAIRKIADCRAFLLEQNQDVPIQVDGNVSFANIPNMVAAGADILVGGTSSIFHQDGSIQQNVGRTRDVIAEGLAKRTAHASNPKEMK